MIAIGSLLGDGMEKFWYGYIRQGPCAVAMGVRLGVDGLGWERVSRDAWDLCVREADLGEDEEGAWV